MAKHRKQWNKTRHGTRIGGIGEKIYEVNSEIVIQSVQLHIASYTTRLRLRQDSEKTM